jgi:hypothetical protein
LFLAGTILVLSLGCESEDGCGDGGLLVPLEAPMAEENLVFDAIQLRVAERTFLFFQDHFPYILSQLVGDMGFDIDHTVVDVMIPVDICQNGCHIDISFDELEIGTWTPNYVEIGFAISVHGNIDIYGVAFIFRIDCDIPLHINQKWIEVDIGLEFDPATGLMQVDLDDVYLTIDWDDFGLNCSGLLGTTIEDLHNEVVNMMNEEIEKSLDDVVQSIEDAINCLPCDFYSNGCPAGSTCVEGKCRQGSRCLAAPMGLAGTLDFNALTGTEGPPMGMPIFLAPGQRENFESDPPVHYDSLEVRMIAGTSGTPHPCVGPVDPRDRPPNVIPVRMDFDEWDDYIPYTETDYYDGTEFMLGVSVSDVFMDWMMYGAYNSGAFCLSLDGIAIPALTTDVLGLLGITGMDDLLGEGAAAPVKLSVAPLQLPKLDVGANVWNHDPDGLPSMIEPLIFLTLPGMGVDMYAQVGGAWNRLTTLSMDIGVNFGLAFTPDNKAFLMLGEDSISLTNLNVSNSELLPEDPVAMTEMIPTLVETFLPQLAGSIELLEIPPMPGIQVRVLAVQGDMPRAGTEFYEYLSVYLDLDLAKKNRISRETEARVVDVMVPDSGQMSIHNPRGMAYPEVTVEVGSDSKEEVEYSTRLDDGFWTPFKPGPTLTVRSPRLALVGEHKLEVRARDVGDYMSLDPTPAVEYFEITPPRRVEQLGDGADSNISVATPGLSGTGGDSTNLFVPAEEDTLAGCACGSLPGSDVMPSMLLLGLFLLARRRGGA